MLVRMNEGYEWKPRCDVHIPDMDRKRTHTEAVIHAPVYMALGMALTVADCVALPVTHSGVALPVANVTLFVLSVAFTVPIFMPASAY